MEVFEKYFLKNNLRTIFSSKVTYPPKMRFFKTHSEVSLWFECSLSLYVILELFALVPEEPFHLLSGGWIGGGWGLLSTGVFFLAYENLSILVGGFLSLKVPHS